MATPYHRHNSTATGIAADLSSSIKGKVVLTTGVSPNGLGAHFVETIAKHHPRLLILAGRSIEKVRATADKIAADPAAAGVETRILILDLASQQQIHNAAKEVLSWKDVDAIDVIVNSAGIMGGPHQTTVEGIENQFGSNHIGHFLFTNLIMSRILAAKNPRVVNISSNGNWLGPVRFSDYNFQDGKVYDMWEAYGQSKSANVLFSKGLAKRLGGKGLKSYSLHPGVTFGTSLGPGIDMDKDMAALMQRWKTTGHPQLGKENAEFDVKTLDECAATHVVAAFDPRIDDYNGAYLMDGHIADSIPPTVQNPEDVDRLWELSEKLVGQKFQY